MRHVRSPNRRWSAAKSATVKIAHMAITPKGENGVRAFPPAFAAARTSSKVLGRAADLLARVSERRISDIAFDCGFNDLSYFNRAFRKRFGATPSELRDA